MKCGKKKSLKIQYKNKRLLWVLPFIFKYTLKTGWEKNKTSRIVFYQNLGLNEKNSTFLRHADLSTSSLIRKAHTGSYKNENRILLLQQLLLPWRLYTMDEQSSIYYYDCQAVVASTMIYACIKRKYLW